MFQCVLLGNITYLLVRKALYAFPEFSISLIILSTLHFHRTQILGIAYNLNVIARTGKDGKF